MAELNVKDISDRTILATDRVLGFNDSESKAPTVKTLMGAAPGVMSTGTCATAAATALKVVTSNDWEAKPGRSILIEFSTANTASDVSLSINQGNAIPVYALNSSLRLGEGSIPAGAMIFTLSPDGTKFYAHTDIVSIQDNQINYANGKIKYYSYSFQDGLIDSITNANLALPPNGGTKATFVLLSNNTNTPNTSYYWIIECISKGVSGSPPRQYLEQTARRMGQGTAEEYKRSGYFSGNYSATANVTWGNWQKITPISTITSGSTDPITSGAVYTGLSAKQDTLVSGTSIKTVNNTSLLGSGNIEVASLTGANAGAVCSTAKATAAKTVSISGFSLYTGVTVKVMFTNGNSAASPTLNVSSTGAKAIKVVKAGSKVVPVNHTGYWRGASSSSTEMWQPYTILELMYDGTDWVIIGNPVVESYYNNSNGYNVYADGKIECWGKVTTSVGTVTTVTFQVVFTQNPCFVAISNGSINSSGSSLGAWTESYSASTSTAKVYVKGTGTSISTPTSWIAEGY